MPGANVVRLAYWLFVVALLPIMFAASRDFGVTTDEQLRQNHGEAIVRYYTSGFRDQTAVETGAGTLHGGFFDVICVAVQQAVPGDKWLIRHFVNSVFGWMGIVFCGLVASRLFGAATGLLAMVLLALSPHYFASSMNNPKDLPFAAMTTLVLYCLTMVEDRPPYLSWRLAAALCATIALAINVRAGGILYIAYLGLLIAVRVATSRGWSIRNVTTPFLRVGVVTVCALVLGTVLWPWAQQQPLLRPIEGLARLSRFQYYAGTVLLNGQPFRATEPPLSYIPWHFAITTPPVVLCGAVLSLLLLFTAGRRRTVAGLWFVTLFPIAYVMARGSTQYHGIRHMLFIYPSLVVLAAAGWIALLQAAHTTPRRVAAWVLMVVGLAEPLVFQVRFHPNQILYYNALVGGPKGAVGLYDLDYWNNSVLQAVSWAASLSTDTANPIRITGEPFHIVRANASRFRTVRYAAFRQRSHLRIESLRGRPDQRTVVEGGFIDIKRRRLLIIKVIRTADGVPLCVVLPGSHYDEVAKKLGLPPDPLRVHKIQAPG